MVPKKGKSKPKVDPTPEQVEAMGKAMSDASLYALYKKAIDRFRASVVVNPATAYRDLVYEIKEASASFVSDVKGADLDVVIASISSLTAANFTTDMEMEQEDKPTDVDLNDLSQWSPNVQKTIMELQQVSGTARHYLSRMHFALALLKSQVSESDFNKIATSIKPPSTVIKIVRSFNRPCGTK